VPPKSDSKSSKAENRDSYACHEPHDYRQHCLYSEGSDIVAGRNLSKLRNISHPNPTPLDTTYAFLVGVLVMNLPLNGSQQFLHFKPEFRDNIITCGSTV
jgi:hypothetical protein